MSHRNAMFVSVAFVLVLLAGIVSLRDRLTTSADTPPTTSPWTTAVPTDVTVTEPGDLPATDATLPPSNAPTGAEDGHDDGEHRAPDAATFRTPEPDRRR